MSRVAICPGSFDPVTVGHLDIITRAANMFDKVIVVVMTNSTKHPSFTAEERMEMIIEACKGLENVYVDCYDGLLADYAAMRDAGAIVKGLRAMSDFEYEFQMALLNKTLDNDCETMFMMTNSKYSYISSSMVNELAGYKGDLAGLVPTDIIQYIKDKYEHENA